MLKLRPATQNAYGAAWMHLRRASDAGGMTDITPADVAAYVSAMQAAGLKGWTIKGHLTVLSVDLQRTRARHLGLVGVNPVGAARPRRASVAPTTRSPSAS